MSQISDDELVTRLRARADAALPVMLLDTTAVRVAGRRRTHARRWVAVGAGAAAAFAFGTVVAGLGPSAPTTGTPAAPAAGSSAQPDGAAATLATGVTAATRATGTGSPWTTGLTGSATGGWDELQLTAGTAEDLEEATSATGVRVDHALRLTFTGAGAEPDVSPRIAWPDDLSSTTIVPGRSRPWLTTLYRAPSDATSDDLRSDRVTAGVVPSDLADAHVVLYSRTPMTLASGEQAHAVEVPTFADPAGSGATIYVVSTQSQGATAVYYVSDDGTVQAADGRCLPASRPGCAGTDDPEVQAALLDAVAD